MVLGPPFPQVESGLGPVVKAVKLHWDEPCTSVKWCLFTCCLSSLALSSASSSTSYGCSQVYRMALFPSKLRPDGIGSQHPGSLVLMLCSATEEVMSLSHFPAASLGEALSGQAGGPCSSLSAPPSVLAVPVSLVWT